VVPLPTEQAAILTAKGVRLGLTASGKSDAIDQCGRALLDVGAVEPDYLQAMHEREASVSTFIGEGVAIPHGTDKARQYVLRTSLVVLQFPEGVDWGSGNQVKLCVGILSALAQILMTPGSAAELRSAADAETVIRLLQSIDEEKDT
jgi:mannitol/fructose-specific phosphotransferase system IIA component